jgi:acylglycerol lipase
MLRGTPPVRVVPIASAMRLAIVLLASVALLCQCATPPHMNKTPVMNLQASTWVAHDGKEMPFKYWPGEPRKPQGVIICIHGLSGAASDFWPVGEAFPAKGYAVYGMQLRGQGNDADPKMRGDIWSSQQWRQDLLEFTALVHQRHSGVPVYWFGESLGALITIDTAGSLEPNQKMVSGLILASPVVALRNNLKMSFLKNLVVRTLLRFSPGRRISLEALGNSEVRVTSGTTHREQMQHTPHYVRDFTLRLFGQIEKLMRGTDADARRIRIPVLVFYTPNDALTPHVAVEAFFSRLTSRDKERVFFPNSFHLILHDVDRAEALHRLQEWLDAMTSVGAGR